MLRQIAASSVRRAAQCRAAAAAAAIAPSARRGAPRTLVTAAQKRKLNKEQLAGEKTAETGGGGGAAATAATKGAKTAVEPTKDVAGTGVGGGGASAQTSQSGGGSGLAPILLMGGVVAAAGTVYYFDLFPTSGDEKFDEPDLSSAHREVHLKTKETEKERSAGEEKVSKEADEAVAAPTTTTEGNRVTTIEVPPVDVATRPPQVVPPVEHAPGGHRVSNVVSAGAPSEGTAAPTVEKPKDRSAEPVVASAAQAAIELQTTTAIETDKTLRQAHLALRSDLDESHHLRDLDKLSESELRVRIVQLSTEMVERTKWEAVRLKEFLAMKEKETAEKYLEILQKQRVEFEDLLARRLREQEDHLARQANAALQAKEDTIQTVIGAAVEASEREHEAELQSASERIEREAGAKYEADLASNLAQAKAAFAQELEGKVAVIESLGERLRKMEEALEVSRNFESGSQKAHKMSAAALALASKLETSQGAAAELAALRAVAGEEGVIASALSKVPSTVKSGVPTLAELQAKFDKVHNISRQAALVPEGRKGLGAQLSGMAFAKLTVPPSPDSVPAPGGDGTETSADSSSDRILARAHKYVQLGELDQAVLLLDKLKGQSAFAVRDWKRSAMDRIAVEKALKIIKMECAILNENMGGGTE